MKTCILALVSVLAAGGVYAQVNPCIICPNGATAGDDWAPYYLYTGIPTTCGEYIDSATLVETASEDCAFYETFEAVCCPTVAAMTPAPTSMNPCIICPNGATLGDEYAPYADSGDLTTCAELIDSVMLFETGSGECAVAEVYEIACCFTVPENPCIICPNGATAGDDYVPYADDGNLATCAKIIDDAKQFETESDHCGLIGEVHEFYCCPSEPENPCIICPNGATAGDEYVPYADEGNLSTCAKIIEDAKQFEAESDYCGVIGEEDKSYCCPSETPAPTPMPVNDITVATTTTSSTYAAPSPVVPLMTSSTPSTTTKFPTVPSSGCASVSELVFTFIAIFSSLCVIALV